LKWQSLIEWLAAGTNIGLNLWLIPKYGILGAVIATFASYLTLPISAWIISHRLLEVDYQWRRLFAASILITASAVCIHMISTRMVANLLDPLLWNFLVLTLFFPSVFLVLLTSSERDQVYRIFKK
jgi:O-antigen/teichoic acid export membrane protein